MTYFSGVFNRLADDERNSVAAFSVAMAADIIAPSHESTKQQREALQQYLLKHPKEIDMFFEFSLATACENSVEMPKAVSSVLYVESLHRGGGMAPEGTIVRALQEKYQKMNQVQKNDIFARNVHLIAKR